MRKPIFIAVATIMVLSVNAIAAGGQGNDTRKAKPGDNAKAAEYWTSERMRAATPKAKPQLTDEEFEALRKAGAQR